MTMSDHRRPIQLGAICLVLAAIVAIGCRVRLQSRHGLPEGYLLDTDSFRMYRQAEMVHRNGGLPKRDVER